MTQSSGFSRGVAPFVVVQVLVVALVAVAAGWRTSQWRAELTLPALREAPLSVRPTYNVPEVITDDELADVLTRLKPRNVGRNMKINHVDHALRFWGAEAEFNAPGTLSGEELRRILVSHERFREIYGDKERPLLALGTSGVSVRVQEGSATSSHVDHTVACLAEVGTPLDFPMRVLHQPTLHWGQRTPFVRKLFTVPQEEVKDTSYGAMVEQAIRDFSLNQVEYEWSALTFVLFMPPHAEWTTTEGQRINFDRLADRLMREDSARGVCFGNHRIYTLVILLRVNETSPQLSDEMKERILAYLKEHTDRLVKHQHREGFWNIDWPFAMAGDAPTEREGDRLSDRILATGHALEWWAMAPADLHPPRDTLRRAAHWLVHTVRGMDDAKIDENFTFLSHAGRALGLWRGKSPGKELSDLVRPTAPAANVDDRSAIIPKNGS